MSARLAGQDERSVALNIQVGQKALVTVDNWFYGPDGRMYRAIFGTVKACRTAEESLGVRPNGKSTNWYLEIGNLTIAGCQIHYAMRCESVHAGPVKDWSNEGGTFRDFERPSGIYVAD